MCSLIKHLYNNCKAKQSRSRKNNKDEKNLRPNSPLPSAFAKKLQQLERKNETKKNTFRNFFARKDDQ